MTLTPRRLAVLDDRRFDEHVSRRPHPERPDRLAAARSGLYGGVPRSDVFEVAARRATREELLSVHDTAYVASLEEILARGGYEEIDADTFCSPGTGEAAWLAAGGAASITQSVLRGDASTGFALLRPPGHHAEPDRAMGFCLLNNVAIAAHAALAAGAERVAIVDWDVHHGNGTQRAFEADPRVLFISLHEWPLYPGTGRSSEVGVGAGLGTTANIALPSGCGDEVYGAAFREIVLPLLRHHAPQIVLVSAGFDAHARDPLARMELTTEGFGALASALVRQHPSLVFLLEGGYDLEALEGSVAATARAALGQEAHDLPVGAIPSAARRALDETLRALRRVLPAGVL